MENRPRITLGFNVILLTYLCVDLLVSSAFDPEFNEKVPWDTVYEAFPVISVTVAVLVGLLLLLWGAKLVNIFWNRFVCDVFEIRSITLQEAFALVLVLAITTT